jgi:predicted nucleic acid-binding protein
MISIETNLLFHAYNVDSPLHQKAYDRIVSISGDENVVLSEFILAELYCLVRNPIIAKNGALSPGDAVALIESCRRHPRWMLAGFSANGRHVHDSLRNHARKPEFTFRKRYDVRTALILREHGVTDFATINLKDFEGLGFRRVWNPVVE